MNDFFVRDQVVFPPIPSDPSASTSQLPNPVNPPANIAVVSYSGDLMVLPGNPVVGSPNMEHLIE